MAITNHERVGKALDLLKAGLGPFVEREIKVAIEARKIGANDLKSYIEDPILADKPVNEWDSAALLKFMSEKWKNVFHRILGPAGRSLVGEMRDHRNKWAHQESFSSDDAYRVLDSTERLLTAVSAPESDEAKKLKMELLRVRFDEQTRGERRKKAGTAIETKATDTLKPWRDVIMPHEDVASGRYQQAEFAADLWQVHLGEGSDEYRVPQEFYRRTYLTQSLHSLLAGAILRLTGTGGDPVVQLQTNFGGGKTHTMLALYHLFSGVAPTELAGIDEIMQEAEATTLPQARRIVLVGNKISPGNPVTKEDGAVVRTLWGELAWQLGGKEAYALVAADDENATSPGDTLRMLFNKYGPCLILIDEWVAYARQLHEKSDLPGGSFDTQFSFAQALTEAAKAAGNCLLVISLPTSDMASPRDYAEVGGQQGIEALNRLKNVVARVESPWRPASAEEGFEIVRRRLFKPLAGSEAFKQRDVVAREFVDLYRMQNQEFPSECRDADYERRIKSAYPIHPEIFDRLYEDWSTLVNFQRTRGVLRLMAAVIHNLWERGDRNSLIMPCSIAIDDRAIQFELTRYLSDNWTPVIEKDVDGASSLPLQTDREVPNLGKLSACRRVARTIYLGSAPIIGAAHQGLEDRQIKLGCVMPGESPAIFGDALLRLANAATYLYRDGIRYWYSTQPTVQKLAEDRAEEIGRDPDKVLDELAKRLRSDLMNKGEFTRVHPLPQSAQDIPDDTDAKLVVLDIEKSYSRGNGSDAEAAAKAILESRGSTPRIYRNSLVFLAADKTRTQELDEAVRRYLAWESIVAEKELLNLDPNQVKQAETQRESASATVTERLPETWQWLLIPIQKNEQQAEIQWEVVRLSAKDALAVRASNRLKNDELLITGFAGTRLRMELDRIPLWRGDHDHVSVKQLIEDFASFLYLPRLRDTGVLLDAISNGVNQLTWERDVFAFADSYDEDAGRYRGLRGGQLLQATDQISSGLLVKPEVARQQLDQETTGDDEPPPGEDEEIGEPGTEDGEPGPDEVPFTRFHGSVELDATRVGRDAGQIADEVISHLSGIVGAEVKVTLEIEATVPDGAPENVVRTVTENSKTLKFRNHGFEKE